MRRLLSIGLAAILVIGLASVLVRADAEEKIRKELKAETVNRYDRLYSRYFGGMKSRVNHYATERR